MIGRRRSLRAGLTILAGSSVSSAANVIASVSGAAVLGPQQYGEYSLIFMITIFVAAVVNALTGEVLISKPATSQSGQQRTRANDAHALRAATLLCVVVMATAAAAGTVLTFAVQTWLALPVLTLVVVVPGVVLRSVFRTVQYARGRQRAVLAMDVIWLMWIVLAMGVVWWTPADPRGYQLAMLWAIGAYVAVLLTSARSLRCFAGSGGLRWLKEERRMAGSLSYGVLVDAGTRHLVSISIGAAGGLAVLGGLRLMQTLFGACTVLFSAGRIFGLTRVEPTPGSMRYVRTMLGMSLTLALVPLLLLALLDTLDGVVRLFVDPQLWAIAESVMLPVALSLMGVGLSQGALVGLRKLQRAGLVARAQTATGLLVLTSGLVGLQVYGVDGGVWGLAVGPLVSSLWYWYYFLSCVGPQRSRGESWKPDRAGPADT